MTVCVCVWQAFYGISLILQISMWGESIEIIEQAIKWRKMRKCQLHLE